MCLLGRLCVVLFCFAIAHFESRQCNNNHSNSNFVCEKGCTINQSIIDQTSFVSALVVPSASHIHKAQSRTSIASMNRKHYHQQYANRQLPNTSAVNHHPITAHRITSTVTRQPLIVRAHNNNDKYQDLPDDNSDSASNYGDQAADSQEFAQFVSHLKQHYHQNE